jgi:hypothetical protein
MHAVQAIAPRRIPIVQQLYLATVLMAGSVDEHNFRQGSFILHFIVPGTKHPVVLPAMPAAKRFQSVLRGDL